MLYKVVLTIESVAEIVKCDAGIQVKAIEQYFPVVLFFMLTKTVVFINYLGLWIKRVTIHPEKLLSSTFINSLFY